MPTLHRSSSWLLVAVAFVASACGSADPAPVAEPASAPAVTSAETTSPATPASPPAPPTTGAPATAPETTTPETPTPESPTPPIERLALLAPPPELGSGFTLVETEGSPPPAAAWQAMAATGACAGVEPFWNVQSVDKLAVRNLQYLGPTPADLRGLVVFVLTPEGADQVWDSFVADPAQLATCWQEGFRVLTGISDFSVADAGGPAGPASSPNVVWRHHAIGSATFGFETTQAFAMLRYGHVVAWASLVGLADEAEVEVILADLDARLAAAVG